MLTKKYNRLLSSGCKNYVKQEVVSVFIFFVSKLCG